MSDDSLSTSEVEIEPPEFIDKREEAEAAFWRLKRAADLWRENRVKRVLAQEGESIFRTFGRVLYIITCILFDGLILIELPIYLQRTAVAWTLYILILILPSDSSMNTTRNGLKSILVRLSLRIIDWK